MSLFTLLNMFLLGLLSAVHPCQLIINISATAYLGKEMADKRQAFRYGLFYTAGRAATYTLLGAVFYFGFSAFPVKEWFEATGEKYIGILLLFIGVLLLDVIPLRLPAFNNFAERFAHKRSDGAVSAFLLGFLFAFGFCMETAGMFFLILVPLTLTSSAGLLLPVAFAVGTALPVVVFAWLLAYSATRVSAAFERIRRTERWLRIAVAVVFILSGLYLIAENFL